MPKENHMPRPTASLDWRAGTIPVSTRFDDPYFSLADGLEETRHVFLAGNELPARFCDGFHIAELGFGTGLNLLCALAAFRESGCPGKLHFTSFEAFPMGPDDITRALSPFAGLQTSLITKSWPSSKIIADDLQAEIIFADARDALPSWSGRADAWFLDGFSPAKNPELWGQPLMREVAHHTVPAGTFATYTAAGHVRRALSEAGFDVTRRPGFGQKRHMSVGRLRH